MKISVIGAGSWGTTLANMLADKGLAVTLWAREGELFAQLQNKHENGWFLPGYPLHSSLQYTNDLGKACKGFDVYLLAVPCQFTRSVLTTALDFLPKKPVILCASKGIELETLAPMSEVVAEALKPLKPRYAILSGPSFAREVIKKLPTAVTLGCADKKLAKELQAALSTDYFRIYTSPDYRGVELGGAVKNVIAIAAGIADGFGFGLDARAALITRGLAEMARLGKAMGGSPQTFMGLSGLGDLVLTCTGDLSRNRQVGLQLAQGKTLLQILGEMKMVAEGVKTTEALYAVGRKLKVDMPITEQVYQVLYANKNAEMAVRDLMTRGLKEE